MQIFLEYQGMAASSSGGERVIVVVVIVVLERSVGVDDDDVSLQIIHFSVVAFIWTIHPRMPVGGFGQMKLGRAATEEELTSGATDVIHAVEIQSEMMVKSSWRETEKMAVFFRLLSSARKLLSL